MPQARTRPGELVRDAWLGRSLALPRESRLALGPAVEVETVRRIFREYASGQSLRSICRTLNIEGAKSPRGREWQSSGLVSVLRNEAYIGDFVWNTQRKGKYVAIVGGELTTDPQRGLNDESDRIVFAEHHPAIIDRQ